MEQTTRIYSTKMNIYAKICMAGLGFVKISYVRHMGMICSVGIDMFAMFSVSFFNIRLRKRVWLLHVELHYLSFYTNRITLISTKSPSCLEKLGCWFVTKVTSGRVSKRRLITHEFFLLLLLFFFNRITDNHLGECLTEIILLVHRIEMELHLGRLGLRKFALGPIETCTLFTGALCLRFFW